MFVLNLVTPEKRLVTDTEIDEILVPGYMGQLDILPGHAPLMSTLGSGVVKYRLKGQSNYETVVVHWGYLEVHPEGVTVLAELAESLVELDRERAEEAAKRAKEALLGPLLESDQIEMFQKRLEKAQTRLAALEATTHQTKH